MNDKPETIKEGLRLVPDDLLVELEAEWRKAHEHWCKQVPMSDDEREAWGRKRSLEEALNIVRRHAANPFAAKTVYFQRGTI